MQVQPAELAPTTAERPLEAVRRVTVAITRARGLAGLSLRDRCQLFEVLGNGLKLRELLQKLDNNGDGTLTKRELTDGIVKLGLSLTHHQVQALITSADIDDDGALSYAEILKAVGLQKKADQDWMQLSEAAKKLLSFNMVRAPLRLWGQRTVTRCDSPRKTERPASVGLCDMMKTPNPYVARRRSIVGSCRRRVTRNSNFETHTTTKRVKSLHATAPSLGPAPASSGRAAVRLVRDRGRVRRLPRAVRGLELRGLLLHRAERSDADGDRHGGAHIPPALVQLEALLHADRALGPRRLYDVPRGHVRAHPLPDDPQDVHAAQGALRRKRRRVERGPRRDVDRAAHTPHRAARERGPPHAGACVRGRVVGRAVGFVPLRHGESFVVRFHARSSGARRPRAPPNSGGGGRASTEQTPPT